MCHYIIGIDTGGTFTDFVLADEQNNYENYKIPSTPLDPAVGIIQGMRQIARNKNLDLTSLLEKVDIIIHGTTVTTNAVLTGTGAKTALLTTEGFRDILEMRRGIRPTFYNNKYIPPQPLVPRQHRFTIQERILADGKEFLPLQESHVISVVEILKEQKIEAIAVCFMHAYLSPNHELRVRNILQELYPEAYLTISAEILPQPRLYERVSTTVLNSYVGPVLNRYINSLSDQLKTNHFEGVFLITTSNGGAASSTMVKKAPVSTLLSGPAAGPITAMALSQIYRIPDCLIIDMGGTSFDASMIKESKPLTCHQAEINTQAVAIPMLDILTIGAGGGSIAWLDSGGFLHMGPQSAGANPGPAAYDLGGTEPTCSDADLILGLLDAKYFLHGRFPLSKEKARQAIRQKIAEPIGLSVEEASWGMYQVITANMANSLKEITVRRGYDPRTFLLIVGGGAGPLHCAYLAKELDIPVMLVPAESSVMCAQGMLLSDLKYDYVKTFHTILSESIHKEIKALLEEILLRARHDTASHHQILRRISDQFSLDLRYVGQHYELTIPFSPNELEDQHWDNILERFHEEHNRQYGYNLKDSQVPVEILCLRLSSIGEPLRKLHLKRLPNLTELPTLLDYRDVYNPVEKKYQPVPVWDGQRPTSQIISGPGLIEKGNTTVFIPDHYSGKYDPFGNLLIYANHKEELALNLIAECN